MRKTEVLVGLAGAATLVASGCVSMQPFPARPDDDVGRELLCRDLP